MARFVFNLAVVLKARENAEQAAQRVVAVARQKLVTLQDALNDLGTQRRQADDEMRKRLVGPIDVSYVAGHRRFVVSMEKQAMDLARQIAVAQAEVEQAQGVLILAARARKTLEILRDRQLERWQEEQAKKEADLLDEAGMQIAFENLKEPADAAAVEAPLD